MCNRTLLVRVSGALLASTFAGCGGALSYSPSNVTGSSISAVSESRPQPNAQALLYVSEPAQHVVAVYTYPGLRARATLRGLGTPQGMCVDERTGNVWIVGGAFGDRVVEFAHGGTTPIRSIKIASGLYPDACAVRPTTGDLAVAAILDNDDSGSLLIYRGGRGAPRSYQTVKMFYYDFVGYDASGNVFVDGTGAAGFRIAELAAGTKTLQIVSPKGLVIHHPGGVQYDGSNLAVGDEKRGLIYHISNGVVIGTTTLQGACFVQQFFIDGGQVVAPNICGSKGEVLVYNYPAGGAPTKKLTGLSYPFGAVVSR